ncbi:hypothetical protein HaLaN_26373 [Haematococcus lacustris]|uniref:Uncharacterized protein n=1 Tax=Haematococcus lacustris TaxID=44745 RepID=A0A6A0A632_HAELA|nr:hypothetical protein HaLaN_26373 [Haematococcus lacustris]
MDCQALTQLLDAGVPVVANQGDIYSFERAG